MGERSGEGRSALLRAARAVMTEKGLPRLTSREVAERAHVKPTLINYYFGGREGLLRAVVAEIAEEATERLEQAAAHQGPVEERLLRVIEAMLEGDAYDARLLFEQVIFADDEVLDRYAAQFGRTHHDALSSVLEDGRREGLFRDVDLEVLLSTIVGTCVFSSLAEPLLRRVMPLEDGSPQRTRQFARHALDLVLHGLLEREGEAR